MGRRLEYEVKTSVRLNMSNPQHVKINDVIQNLDPKIFKSKNQFIIDAIQFYIDNYGKETFVIKKKEKERAEYIRSEDIDDIKEEVIEAATNEARKEVIKLLGVVISGMNVGQPVIMQAANSEAQEPTEDVMDDADVAGQTVANAFLTFADKPEVDYSQKEQKHPITKAVLAPMKAVKKMLVSIEIHLDASIDKLDNLAMDVRMDKEKNKDDMKHNDQMEADRKEAAPERVEAEIVYAPVVAETHEYQYNADAFEARGAADMKVEIGKEVSKVREDKAR